jgi:phytoene/squalene synthetase
MCHPAQFFTRDSYEASMTRHTTPSGPLAAEITRSASKQTYFTILLFADRDRREDAFRAYGYFRWLDDVIDTNMGSPAGRTAFVNRQRALLDACLRGKRPATVCIEEDMLVDLAFSELEAGSGLQVYLQNMMEVMAFDAARRGRVISQSELDAYTHRLAVGVTEALYYFIGHENPAPGSEARYLAVTAAHLTHMLRDSLEDVQAGYYNIPREYLAEHGLSPQEVTGEAGRAWVCAQVKLAREYFSRGHKATAQVRNLRCRLAGYLYTARFEWILNAIERDNYCLREAYPERKGLRAALWMISQVLKDLAPGPLPGKLLRPAVAPALRTEKK